MRNDIRTRYRRRSAARRWLAFVACLLPFLPLVSGCGQAPFLAPKVPTPTATAMAESMPTSPQITPELAAPTHTLAVAVVVATDSPVPTDTAPPTSTVPPMDTATLVPTVTETVPVTPTATATLTITAPIRLASEPICENELVRIQGMIVTERTVEFTGTAAIGNMAYYKFEYQGAGEGEWHFIGSSEEPVQDGSLYIWDTSVLAPGSYRVHLMVVDRTGNYPPPCGIEIEIIE